ncbi:MAG: Holliday junction branch migration protein RuvA [Bacteroidales bacterium]
MIEHIKGKITSLTPTYVVIETGGLGYFVNISLSTFSKLDKQEECSLLIHEVIREDAHLLFGFNSADERYVFRLLISVSGVGANTARMMLSSVEASGIEKAILQSDVNLLKGIKGIGAKTAQRIIVDLKDKVGKSADAAEIFADQGNTIREEAFTALVMLGFPKNSVNKSLDKLLREERDLSVEQLIKKALKIL